MVIKWDSDLCFTIHAMQKLFMLIRMPAAAYTGNL